MSWVNYIFSFVIPATFILVGFILWKHPPKEINGTSGWRTEQSEKNQETWDFANLLGAKCTLIFGIIEFLCTFITLFFTSDFDENETGMFMIVLVIIQSACFAIVYVYVERKLREHFKQ